jgi:ribosomal-protein-alanine N-acetyltransferase
MTNQAPTDEAPRLISTARLRLLAPDVSLADAVARFHTANRAHFKRWDPPQLSGWGTVADHEVALRDGDEAFRSGRALRWWLVDADRAERVIGNIHLSNIVCGCFQSCHLGYAIAADREGRGLMTEALAAVIAAAFSPAINLHRLQAAVQADNPRSLALLARLGFSFEGLARDYLFINGAWRDHRLFSLLNVSFVKPTHW